MGDSPRTNAQQLREGVDVGLKLSEPSGSTYAATCSKRTVVSNAWSHASHFQRCRT